MDLPSFIPVLLLSSVIAVIPGSTDALQCYVCNSTVECQTTFDPTEHRLEECDGYCYKTTMEDMSGNMMFVRRGCEPSDMENCPNECLQTSSTQCNMCCQEDACNSATTLSTYFTSLLTSVVLFVGCIV